MEQTLNSLAITRDLHVCSQKIIGAKFYQNIFQCTFIVFIFFLISVISSRPLYHESTDMYVPIKSIHFQITFLREHDP